MNKGDELHERIIKESKELREASELLRQHCLQIRSAVREEVVRTRHLRYEQIDVTKRQDNKSSR